MVAKSRTFDLSDDVFELSGEDGPSAELAALREEVAPRLERKRKTRTIAASVYGRAVAEVREMFDSGRWEGVSARHLVAVYDVMHAETYGVEAGLSPSDRYAATMMAAGLVRREFGGDFAIALEYMRWAWAKEERDERWRRENGRVDGRRLGHALMFGGRLVPDFRLYLARTGKAW